MSQKIIFYIVIIIIVILVLYLIFEIFGKTNVLIVDAIRAAGITILSKETSKNNDIVFGCFF